jgi:hypothetical protein
MRLDKEIVVYASEEARKRWEGLKLPKKNKKSSCPSCDLEKIIKENSNDYINKEKQE